MVIRSRTESRLALAIVLTAVIPLVVSLYFVKRLVYQVFAQAFTPELGQHLDQARGVYRELAKSVKDDMRHQADAIAAGAPLREAAQKKVDADIDRELDAAFAHYPDLASLGVAASGGAVVASKTRTAPVNVSNEVKLEVRRPLGMGDGAPELVAVFAAPRARFDELTKTSEFVDTYHQIELDRNKLENAYLWAFGAILAVTIAVAVALGMMLARSVTRRINALALATQAVAQGDLTVRVPEHGDDELTDLSRGFNRMLSEVEDNRARIEFLQRIGAWQEMARRLAHEIKNPLTPILLAVEECHRKYGGEDPQFRKLLDTTLEVVEEEVGTLRRLVGEFSSFARLPRAELAEADLGDFLRDQESRPIVDGEAEAIPTSVNVSFTVPDGPMPAAIDRQMLSRVLVNVLRNAAQAITGSRDGGHIAVRVDQEPGSFSIVVDDDGPGVPEDLRTSIFDPYMTTKKEGTGLGLAIVKKIVVEHGGTIGVGTSALGGASFRIRIPRLSSAAARAARS
jgi:two-component system, NtrC family, nitrogen regulation sensor histidine kinase NtrY